MSTTETPKPILLAALLCSKVLQEKDGSLSIIRMIDRITVTVPTLPEEIRKTIPEPFLKAVGAPVVDLNVIVSLKAGDYVGPVIVQSRVISTKGKAGPLGQMGQADFDRPEAGINLIGEIRLLIKNVGLVWIEILVNDQIAARIPLVVRLAEGSAPLPAQDSPDTEPSL